MYCCGYVASGPWPGGGPRSGKSWCRPPGTAHPPNVHHMAVPKLQLIGGGKMGEALLAGLVGAGWASADELRVVEKLPERAAELTDRFPGVDVADDVAPAAGHVVAVK